MWLHLGGPYWQRASFDAIVVIAALLGLFAYAPTLEKFHPRHWWTAAVLLVALALFGLYLARAFRHASDKYGPWLEQIEAGGPE
jgi:Na+/melibiose symporter-like transporter